MVGLYICTRNKEVVQAAVPGDHLAFQIGEAAQIHSGGVLQATPHSVKASATHGVSRATLAVFMQPQWDDAVTREDKEKEEKREIQRKKEKNVEEKKHRKKGKTEKKQSFFYLVFFFFQLSFPFLFSFSSFPFFLLFFFSWITQSPDSLFWFFFLKMEIPEGGKTEEGKARLERGARGELLPPGVPALLSRWKEGQNFGEFTDATLKAYY